MRGHYVARKAGWDCHGLPVEIEVEKELGITNKHEIEEYGIARVQPTMPRVGPPLRRGLVRAHRRASACGSTRKTRTGRSRTSTSRASGGSSSRSGTPATSTRETRWSRTADVAAPRSRATSSASPACTRTSPNLRSTCAFPVVDRDFDLLVWTTTPWTLVSNVAAAVGPGHRLRPRARRTTAAATSCSPPRASPTCSAMTPRWSARSPSTSSSGCTTSARSTTCRSTTPDAARVVADEFVTIDDGSGIVHLAPAFGEIDREVAEREGLPMLNPVGPAATFVDAPYRRTFRQGRRPRAHRRARRVRDASCASSTTTHSYPHCWRCGTPLDLLGEARVVRAHHRAQGRAAARERGHRLAS